MRCSEHLNSIRNGTIKSSQQHRIAIKTNKTNSFSLHIFNSHMPHILRVAGVFSIRWPNLSIHPVFFCVRLFMPDCVIRVIYLRCVDSVALRFIYSLLTRASHFVEGSRFLFGLGVTYSSSFVWDYGKIGPISVR